MRTAFASSLLVTALSSFSNAQTTCTLCPDGSSVGNPTLTVPLLTVNEAQITCDGLAAIADLFGDRCNDIQRQAGFCGCPGIEPVNACSLCPDGSPPGNPTQVTPITDDTCADLDSYASFLTAEECATDLFLVGIEDTAPLCGCPGVEAECNLCPDGSMPPDPTFELPNGLTCGEAYASLLVFNTEVCARNERLIELHSFRCGCEGAPEPEVFCRLCPDGSAPPNPDDMTPFGLTCAQADSFYADLDQGNCDTLSEVRRIEAELCGCSGVQEANCTLCPDGSDVGFPQRQIPYKFIDRTPATCGLLDAVADVLNTDCEAGVQSEKGFCGCNGVSPANACTFCPDGSSPPDPNKRSPLGNTCGEMEAYVSFFADTECQSTRLNSIRLDTAFCGCPGAEPRCTLCPDGSPPDQPDLILPDNTTCQYSADLYMIASEPVCDQLKGVREQEAALCGCSGSQQLCTLCSDGQPPVNGDVEIRAGTKCSDIAALALTLTAAECDTRSATVQHDAYRCGCRNTSMPTCKFQENPDKCTTDLLATTSETCECYSFCDGALVDCDSFEGFDRPECPGEAVYGCNAALAFENEGGSSANAVHVSFWKLLAVAVMSLLALA